VHPLDGPLLKLTRADVHLRCLEREIRDFRQSDAHRVIEKYESKTGTYKYEPHTADTPDCWGPLIGDIAHNLRSALDHLAWQLAILGGSTPGGPNARWGKGKISWPIYRNAKNYRGQPNKRGVRPWRRDGLLPAHARLVRQFQPYQRRQAAKSHPLWLLSHLSNIDKHQILHTTGVTFDKPGVPFYEQFRRSGAFDAPADAPVEAVEQHVRSSLRTGEKERDLYLKGGVGIDVEFSQLNTEFHGHRVLPLLHEVRAEVQAVLDAFAPFV